MFLFQVFVNSAMTMGIAPITGIPLPFVSVGGSSMLTNFLALGDPAGDLHAPRRSAPVVSLGKGKLSPLAALVGVLREVRRGARPSRGRSPSPARASSCRCSRASCGQGGDAAAVVEDSASTAPRRSSGSARPTRRELREASRRRRPDRRRDRRRDPAVRARDRPRARAAGQGLPASTRSRRARPPARRRRRSRSRRACRCCASRSCDTLDRRASRERNALIAAAVFIPGVDMPS